MDGARLEPPGDDGGDVGEEQEHQNAPDGVDKLAMGALHKTEDEETDGRLEDPRRDVGDLLRDGLPLVRVHDLGLAQELRMATEAVGDGIEFTRDADDAKRLYGAGAC